MQGAELTPLPSRSTCARSIGAYTSSATSRPSSSSLPLYLLCVHPSRRPARPRIDALPRSQIVSAVQAADPDNQRFDKYALVGLVVMSCMPTTVSSNVTMTGLAGGDVAGTTIEVLLGNTLGTFLSPALLEMFLSSSTWAFGKPVASGGGGIGEVYRQVIEQLGYSCVLVVLVLADDLLFVCSVFIPLFVGECIQWKFPKQTKWCLRTFYLGKVGTFCLLLVIWCVSSCSSTLACVFQGRC